MSLFHPPKLLTADEFAHDLVASITNARNQIAITTTTFRDDDPRSHAIVEALCKAAERDVSVSVCVDTFTYLEPKEFLLRSPKRQPARAMRALQLERTLKSHGILFRWLGRKTNAVVYGRTHSKWVIVDDTVYSFGGTNLDNDSFTNTDYMIRFHDAKLAALMIAEHLKVQRADRGGGAFRSHKFALDSRSTILLDGGLVTDSLIYRRAYQLAKEAKSIICVSQYSPTGRLARALKRKNAKLYFNDWRTATLVNRFIIRIGNLTARQKSLYTKETYLHAKFMLFTMPDGSKIALSGSHNFMFGSGIVGTRESALETTNPHIIKQLENFYKKHVA